VKKRLRQIYWINGGHWPIDVGLCPSVQAFDRFVSRHESEPGGLRRFEDTGTAAAVRFLDLSRPPRGMNRRVALLTIHPERVRGITREMLAALVAHEAVHIKQWMHDVTGEKAPVCETGPGAESEAYFVQSVTQGLLVAYLDVVGHNDRRKKRKR
jgi:hypothetical protein